MAKNRDTAIIMDLFWLAFSKKYLEVMKMAWFGFGKKKEEVKCVPACACQSGCEPLEASEVEAADLKKEGNTRSVKVLGVGCASCHEQYEQAKTALKSMGA